MLREETLELVSVIPPMLGCGATSPGSGLPATPAPPLGTSPHGQAGTGAFRLRKGSVSSMDSLTLWTTFAYLNLTSPDYS